MTKVGVLGLKDDREAILSVLHDLRAVQVEPISRETLEYLPLERASDTQRTIADEALRFRGLRIALPARPIRATFYPNRAEILAAAERVPIDREVGELKREDDRLLTEEKSLTDQLELLGKLSFYAGRLEYLHAKNALAFFGEATRQAYDALRTQIPASSTAAFLEAPGGAGVRFLVAARSEEADTLSRLVQSQGVRLEGLPGLSGTPTEEAARLRVRRTEVGRRRAEIRTRLEAIADEWYSTVASLEEAFAIENRTLEVYTRLGGGSRTFALEGWVALRDLPRLESAVARASGGRAYLYRVPTEEDPPTLLDNPPGIRWYEFFIKFYSLPQATEWDPTFVFAIVFPIFFGFMLGDWGYGLTILLISVWMIAGFPGARFLPKSGKNFVKLIMGPEGMRMLAYALLPGCAIAIGLGLYWDEFFGFGLLHYLFGYHPAVKPEATVGRLLLIAGYIGLGMVTLGFLFGALKEYFHHHIRGVLAKSGGILFAWGIAFFGLGVLYHHPFASLETYGTLVAIFAGLGLLLTGEGLMSGFMGLIEIVSHILSYTRLIGILLASVILAIVINRISSGLFGSGSVGLFIAGLVILVIGQTFNVIIGVFEPGIQGARLIFVEYFSKFYSGNGRPFRPFGAVRRHTISTLDPPAARPPGLDAKGPLIRAAQPEAGPAPSPGAP